MIVHERQSVAQCWWTEVLGSVKWTVWWEKELNQRTNNAQMSNIFCWKWRNNIRMNYHHRSNKQFNMRPGIWPIYYSGREKVGSLFYLLTTERKCVLVTQQSPFWYFRQFDIQLIQVYRKWGMVPEDRRLVPCVLSLNWVKEFYCAIAQITRNR